jgi:hypothetical protein
MHGLIRFGSADVQVVTRQRWQAIGHWPLARSQAYGEPVLALGG